MANLTEVTQWENGIYKLETTDPVVGGDSGVSNIQANQLANRTQFLKDEVEEAQNAALLAQEAAADAQETADLKVAKAGDVMTGPLTIPAGTDAGHAVNKSQLDAAATAAVPSGAVMSFARNTAPTGWLECDGAVVSRTTYAALFASIGTVFGAGDGSTTFKLPDMRGEFIRGWDDGRGIDTGRAFGASQTDAMQGHHHSVAYPFTGSSGGALTTLLNTVVSSNVLSNTATNPISDGVNGAPRTAAETRPRNIALLYCIKV